jgi:hypothetical protein
MARLQVQTQTPCQCTHLLYHIVDCSHVENSSQATLPRKMFNHDLMHDLRGKRNEIGSKRAVVQGSLRHRQLARVCWHSGVDHCQGNPWHKCLAIFCLVTGIPLRMHGNEHSSSPSGSSPFRSSIWTPCPETTK